MRRHKLSGVPYPDVPLNDAAPRDVPVGVEMRQPELDMFFRGEDMRDMGGVVSLSPLR